MKICRELHSTSKKNYKIGGNSFLWLFHMAVYQHLLAREVTIPLSLSLVEVMLVKADVFVG